jgi:hypothetical protein
MIAALFVETNGCYFGLDGVDPWDRDRDARLYAGPWPVVAHPPCERWGRYANGGPAWRGPKKIKGDDAGCFAAALAAVRCWGGVLEHPADSAAWKAHGLLEPDRGGGWVRADWMDGFDGWTCCVEQGAYGHRARKATWLYAHGTALHSLDWGRADGEFVRAEPGLTRIELARAVKTGMCQLLSKKQRRATPVPFRDLLISMAETANASRSQEAA